MDAEEDFLIDLRNHKHGYYHYEQCNEDIYYMQDLQIEGTLTMWEGE